MGLRHRPRWLAVIAVCAGLTSAMAVPGQWGRVAAQDPIPAECPGRVGPWPAWSGRASMESGAFGEVSCFYRNRGEPWTTRLVLSARWLTSASGELERTESAALYCERPDGETVGPGQHGAATRSGHVAVPGRYAVGLWVGESGGPGTGRIRAAARRLADAIAPRAIACLPGSVTLVPSPSADPGGDPSPVRPRRTTLVRTGEAARAILEGGAGARIDLEEADHFGIVVTADGVALRDDLLGDSATVEIVDIAGTGPDGRPFVLVTVVFDAKAARESMEPDSAPSPVSPGGASAPTAPTRTEPPGPTPPPATTRPPTAEPRSDASTAALGTIARIAGASVAEARRSGRAVAVLDPATVAALVSVSPDLVASLRLEDGRIIARPVEALLPDIELIPAVDPESGRLAIRVPLLAYVERMLGYSGLTDMVQSSLQALEQDLAAGGVRVTDVRVRPAGIEVSLERVP